MSVSYRILDTDDKIVVDLPDQACFSQLPFVRAEAKDPTNYLVYDVVRAEGVTKELACAYLSELKDMGFYIRQDPADILENGYRMDFKDLIHGKNGICISELGGNLTVVRYIWEFSRLIGWYFNLRALDPTLDKWKAFQLVHYANSVTGKHDLGGWFGTGHLLIGTSWTGVIPFKTMEEVQQQFEAGGNSWAGGTFKINKHYGKAGKFPDGTCIDIETKDDVTKWVKYIEEYKAEPLCS